MSRIAIAVIAASLVASAAEAETKRGRVKKDYRPVIGRKIAAEPWKGTPPNAVITTGALAGVAIYDGTVGGALIGTGAVRLVERGFAPEINNQAFLEAQFGPLLLSGQLAWFYSLHVRWDFHYDDGFTVYGLGGLAGSIFNSAYRLYPRFGVGGMFAITEYLTMRAEISHELIGVGISFYI